MKLVQTLNKVGLVLQKNSPAILTGVGVVGLGATGWFAYKSAAKVEVVVADIEYIRDNNLEFDRVQLTKNIIGAVALPIALGAATILCFAASYKIQNNRILGLTGALAANMAERAYYEAKFKSDYGEEEHKKFMTPVTREERTFNKDGEEVTEEVSIQDDSGGLTGNWYKNSEYYTSDDHRYNQSQITSTANKLDLILFRRGHLLMNEVNDELGFPRTRMGNLLGWKTSTGFNIEQEVTNCLNEAGELRPEIFVRWTTPVYVYETIEFGNDKGML